MCVCVCVCAYDFRFTFEYIFIFFRHRGRPEKFTAIFLSFFWNIKSNSVILYDMQWRNRVCKIKRKKSTEILSVSKNSNDPNDAYYLFSAIRNNATGCNFFFSSKSTDGLFCSMSSLLISNKSILLMSFLIFLYG